MNIQAALDAPGFTKLRSELRRGARIAHSEAVRKELEPRMDTP